MKSAELGSGLKLPETLNFASQWVLSSTYECIFMACLPLDPQEQDHAVHVAAILDLTVDLCVSKKATTSVSTLSKPSFFSQCSLLLLQFFISLSALKVRR
jgi:hypothetical protein